MELSIKIRRSSANDRWVSLVEVQVVWYQNLFSDATLLSIYDKKFIAITNR